MPAKVYVGVKGVIVQDHQLLILKRTSNSGEVFWDLPGGRLEEGEDFSACLSRELKEELPSIGSFKIGPLLGVRKRSTPITDGTEIVFIYFQVATDLTQVTLSDEHSSYLWASVADIKNLKEPYSDKYIELLTTSLKLNNDKS